MRIFWICSWYLFVLCFATSASSLEFSDVIKDAANRPYEVLSQASVVNEKKYRLKESTSYFWPKINFSASAGTYKDTQMTSEDTLQPSEPRARNAYTAGAEISYDILNSYFVSSKNMSLKQSELSLAQAELRSVKIQSIRKAVQLYLDILKISSEVKKETDLLEIEIKQKSDIDNKFRQGRTNVYDQTMIDVDINNQQSKLKALNANVKSRKFELIKYLGRDLTEEVDFKISLSDLYEIFYKQSVQPLSESLKRGLELSPLVVKKEEKYHLAVKQRIVNKGTHLPTLDLTLSMNSNSSLRNEITDDDSVSYGSVLKLTVPVFSGLRSFHEDLADRQLISASRYEHERAKRDLLLDLRRSYESFELAQIELVDSRKNLELAQKGVNQVNRLYDLGRRSLQELLDSYQTVIKAEKRIIKAMHDFILYRFEVNLIIGEIVV